MSAPTLSPPRRLRLWRARRAAKPAPRLVVVGNGMVGWRFCLSLVEQRLHERWAVTILGEEPQPAYNRVRLTECFDGRTPADLELASRDWYAAHRLELHTGDPAIAIDRAARTVTTRAGRKIEYDRLVFATGASAFVPSIPGADLPGVFVYRTLADLAAIRARAAGAKTAAVLGGGLLGLEAAHALLKLGLATTVVERNPGLMSRQLTPTAAALLRRKVEALGLHVRVNSDTLAVRAAEDGALAIQLAQEIVVRADLLVIATGIRPRHELAAACGLPCAPRGGIVVDDTLTTADARIHAIGECASHRGVFYGLAAPGYQMAEILAARLAGRRRKFRGGSLSARLKLLGVDVAALGEYQEVSESVAHASDGAHCELFHRSGRLIGAVSVGPNPEAARLQDAVERRIFLWPWRRSRFLERGRLWGDEAALHPNHWPASAVVCNCKGVTRGTLSEACRSGCRTVNDLALATEASLVCGSCRPLLAQIVGDDELVPRPAAGRGGLLATCAGAVALLAVAFSAGPFAPGNSVEHARVWERWWTDPAWQRATGFTVLGLAAVSLVLSARKRLRWIAWGEFGWWRVVHTALGVLGLAGLFAHTGLQLGSNLNRLLMLDFLALIAAGACAGSVTALEAQLDVRTARRLRTAWTWSHIALVWPLPGLVIFHVLSAYYF